MDIRSFIDVDVYHLREIFDELESTVEMLKSKEIGHFQKVAIFVSFQCHGITLEGTTMALLNTSDKQIQSQVFELEERLKRLACKKGCYVVSLLEMCRSQATNLKT